MWTFSIIHFHFKERSFDLHSKGGDLPMFSPILIPLPFQENLVVPSVGVWLFQKCEDLHSPQTLVWFGIIKKACSFSLQTTTTNSQQWMEWIPGICVVKKHHWWFCCYRLNALGTAWNVPWVSCGKERRAPPPPAPTTVYSLVTRNSPPNKNQTNQIVPDSSPWDEGTKQLVEMAPRGRVVLFVSPSTPFFLEVLGIHHGDLK